MNKKITQSNAVSKMQKGGFSNVAMDLDWSYYDTYKIEPGKVEYRFFTESLGQGASSKTLAETNLHNPGAMPQGHTFECRAIKIMFFHGDVQTDPVFLNLVNGFFWNSVAEVRFQGKDAIGQWTLHELLGMSASYTVVNANSADNAPVHSYRPEYKNVYPLNIPITFPALQNFSVNVSLNCGGVPAGLEDSFLRICLNGKLTRLV